MSNQESKIHDKDWEFDSEESKEVLLKLFSQHSELVNFGSPEDAPSLAWISNAERELGIIFPDEYVWFLNEFGGGDICGEEIYSIYCIPFNEAIGGDIVYQNKITNDNVPNRRLVISNTDFGEEFYFDLDDKYKLYISFGEKKEIYSSNFLEFLYKRLLSYI